MCGNGLDDDCDGVIDENILASDCIIQTNITCGYGAIPPSGCVCGGGIQSSGYCCNGEHSLEPCPEFPWWIFIVIGVIVLVIALVFYFLKEKGKGSQENQWAALEKKYTPARM